MCRVCWLLAIVLLACAGVSRPLYAADSDRLNVLFIAVDDMRVELGCYGNTPALSPNIDRLAGRGVTFNRAYCQQAVCNPSRASLLTGRRPDTLRIWDLPTHFRELYPDIVTLPQHFKNNGYFTQGIGKIFHNWRQNIEGDPASWSVPAELHYATHGSDQPIVDGELPEDTATTIKCEARDVADNAYFDGRIAELAIAALDQLNDKPFFLAVGFWKPHLPFNAPKRYWDLYDRTKLSLPAHPEPPIDVPELALHNGRELLGAKGRNLTDAEVLELRHGYYAGISYLDAQVGKVLAELKRLQLDDDTVIVFWSDHGFHLGEQGLWCKTSNFELDARVPLIISTPEMRSEQRGTQSDSLVELLDLYPTLVDLCGLPEVSGMEGVSLRPVLNDSADTVKPAAYTQHPRPAYYKGKPDVMGCSVRTARYRFTEWRDFMTGKVVAKELYDHESDPGESRNVAASPPDVAALEDAVNLLERGFPRRGYD
ncbi:MAG: sulfatase [Planctomycetes bacterium]|nr:sulfatase [Planctomycetota bacterium]